MVYYSASFSRIALRLGSAVLVRLLTIGLG